MYVFVRECMYVLCVLILLWLPLWSMLLLIMVMMIAFRLLRRIIDGAGSRTVFTGNRKGQEMPFTLENYHAAGSFVFTPPPTPPLFLSSRPLAGHQSQIKEFKPPLLKILNFQRFSL